MKSIVVYVPKHVYDVLDTIEKNGYEAYLVGGLIRDTLLGRDNKDYDIATNMQLDELRKIYNTLTIMKENDHRNTGILKIDGDELEISTFRGKTLEEDLKDRDFKMNALACDKNGNIIDYVGGIKDIENKKISLIKDDGYGFILDPLRMIRAVRFAATLDFEIDDETNEQILNKIDLLEDVARERIYTEFKKIMLSDKPSKTIDKYGDVFEYLIPELVKMKEIRHRMQKHHTDESIWEHTVMVLDNTKANLILRIAALFHDTGKVKTLTTEEDGHTHFYGHELVSCECFKKFAKLVKMDYDTRDAVLLLIENHGLILKADDDHMLKRFLSTFDLDYLDEFFDLQRADLRGQNPDGQEERIEEINSIEKRCNEIINSNECLSIKDLDIDGSDLILIGYEGKEIGMMLSEMLEQIIDDELLNEKDMLLDYALSKKGNKNEN